VPAVASNSIPFGSALGLAFLFLGFVLFAGIAALSHAEERAFSAAMIYLGLGAAAGAVIRYGHVGRVASPLHDHELVKLVTDGALVLALFSTGMRIRRGAGAREWELTLRLIALALPLAVAAGALWAWGLMGLGTGAAIALGAALAPTDPVLAGDLGVAPPEEAEEEVSPAHEFTLTTEGGLNDGVALPFVFLGIAVARGDSLWGWALTHLLYGMVVAVVVGAVVGRLAVLAASELRARRFLSDEFDRWVGLAAAFLVYGAAESLGAIGFVAAFVGGVAFRRGQVENSYRRDVHDGASVMKHFAELTVILLLGSMLLSGGIGAPGGWGLGFAAASIFLLRPLTAVAALAGAKRLSWRERLWIAWFGVKGVASLNYAALIAAAAFARADTRAAVWTVLVAVALSIVIHGITSTPLTRALLGRER
jgi:NhaP-type Na+/H+ or K+/H+ antiporter